MSLPSPMCPSALPLARSSASSESPAVASQPWRWRSSACSVAKRASVGKIIFDGQDLLGLSEKERHALRGDRLSMVFQDPLTSLDPAYGIGEQVAEAIRAHRSVSATQAREQALSLLKDVGIPAAEQRYDEPPHRLSGGMRQRVVVATALANEPRLLIADEPSTALDVTIQAQILELLLARREDHDTAILLITHDLGVVAQVCDRVAVMYAGQLVEVAPVVELFHSPRHPYTRALLDAQPTRGQKRGSLRVIQGEVPDLSDPPPGCRFAPRCSLVRDACAAIPPLGDRGPGPPGGLLGRSLCVASRRAHRERGGLMTVLSRCARRGQALPDPTRHVRRT